VASNLMTMPVTVGRPLNSFGLKHNADPFQPSVVDIVSSQEGYQESILSDYDSVAGRLPAVAGIVPSGGRRLLEMAGPGGGATTTQEILRSQSEDTLTEEYISAGTGVEHLNIGEMLQSVEPEAPRAVQETPAARLRVLEGLRSQGLISEEEYQRIRRKILSEI